MGDIIMQMIDGTARLLGKILTGEDGPKNEIIIEQAEDAGKLTAILFAMVANGEYNQAENLLFEQLEKTPDIDIYSAGLAFYEKLSAVPEEKLAEGGFSREEIAQGIRDMRKFISRYLKKPTDGNK